MILDHSRLLIERYRVGEPLGAGGMGTVYAGYDTRLDRAVAIKLLRDDLARDPSFRQRFEREARAAARVSHPNAVAVYDTGEDASGETFIVMELLSGRTLGDELAEGPLDAKRLREVADGVLAALVAAHGEGIVHRDVKPGNVLLADDGAVKVGDFGIATSLDRSETTTGVPLGTPAYSAPERLHGLPATARSDLYSLAVVLFEASTGARPFTGEGPSAVAAAVVAGDHRPLGELRPDLPPAFVATVERALATDPADRFADAGAMRASMASVPAESTIPLSAPAPTAPTPTAVLPPRRPPPAGEPRFDRRPPAVVAAVAAAVVAAIVVVVVLVLALRPAGDDGETTPPASTTPTSVVDAPAPVTSAPPAPLARALDRLEGATQP